MDAGQKNQLRDLLTKANEFQNKKASDLIELPRTINPGDHFIFPVDLPVTFVAVKSNSKDKELWFFVPGDNYPGVGTRDVSIPGFSSEGPLNFRCGYGIWIHSEDIKFDNRIGQLEKMYVEHIHDHLARDVRDNLPTAESLVATDSDPDYEEWMDELSSAVQVFKQGLLDQALLSEGHETSQDPMDADSPVAYFFTTNWMEEAGIESQIAMAADASGIGKIPELDEDQFVPVGAPVKLFSGPGVLIAIKYASEVVFQLYNVVGDHTLPDIKANGEKLEWQDAGSYWATDEIEWKDGVVEFSVNGEQYPPIEQ